MKKLLLATLLAGVGSNVALAKHEPFNPATAMGGDLAGIASSPFATSSSVQSRKAGDQIIVEFLDPSVAKDRQKVKVAVASLASDVGREMTVVNTVLSRFVIIKVSGVRSDADLVSLMTRVAASKEILKVEADMISKPQSVNSFPNPGWKNFQFPAYSSNQDALGRNKLYNPRFLEQIHFFEENIPTAGIGIVDGDFRNLPNIPHTAFAATQTVLSGVFSPGVSSLRRTDEHGAGISSVWIGQENDRFGVIGLARKMDVVAVNVFPREGGAFNSDGALGALYAANLHQEFSDATNPRPVKVVNLSFNSFGNGCDSSPFVKTLFEQMLANGVLSVASAGNDGGRAVFFPADCPGVISVGAATGQAEMASFSNRGPAVDIYALGDGPGYFRTFEGTDPSGSQVGAAGGTSFSGPLVTLAVSYAKSVNPSLTADQTRKMLKETALPFVSGECAGDLSCGGLFDPVGFIRVASGGQNLLNFTKYTGANSEIPTGPGTNLPQPEVIQTAVVTVPFSGTASSPVDLRITFADGRAAQNSTVSIQETSFRVNVESKDLFEVRFRAIPNSNGTSMQPSGDGRVEYRFTVDNRGDFVEVSSFERLGDPTQPQPPEQAIEPNIQPQPPIASSGGGGYLGFMGLIGVVYLVRRWKLKAIAGGNCKLIT